MLINANTPREPTRRPSVT